jgi:hypothetical protein
MSRTKTYEKYLWGCRFCPMCKPASDSLNATLLECHATRAHAMIIWRAANDIKDYSEKDAELLYKCNLDGVAEAFCVDHYPATGFMLAAREDIVEAGRVVPAPVAAVLNRAQDIKTETNGDMLVFAEGADICRDSAWKKAGALAKRLKAGVISGRSGYMPYVLGGWKKAMEEAKSFAEAVEKTGAKTLVAPGPESYYTFTKLYRELGVNMNVNVVSMTRLLFAGKAASEIEGKKVFFHDARAAYYLGDTKPDEKVIMPDFFGPEELLGEGEVYELPRRALAKGGAKLVFSVWSRAMANAMGNDEGVSLTYPGLAEKMAERRLRMIAETGAEMVVTDSLATAVYLETLDKALLRGMEFGYLGDM